MSGRNHAYLDLAALPAVGSALLAENPVLLYAADARRILFANGAGAAFLGEAGMGPLLERNLSAALPATGAIARFARNVPLGTARLERIRFQSGGRLVNMAAHCTHLALPGGEGAVLVSLQEPRAPGPLADRARRLVDSLAAEDCLVAIVGEDGRTLASAGDFEALAAGEAAIEQLVLARTSERLIKRVVRINDTRRPAGMARFESAGLSASLVILGPAERIEWEPQVAAPVAVPPAEVRSTQPEEAEQVTAAPPIEPVPTDAEADMPAGEAAPEAPADTAAALEEPPSAFDAVPDAEQKADMPSADIEALEPVEAESAAAAEPSEEDAVPDTAPSQGPVPEAGEAAFRFVRPEGPTRFVFQMDGETRFTFVSPDLAAIVGPRSADIVGASWAEIAAARHLDPSGAIAAVLARRDTWSGVTLDWPVDGSTEQVAVDLAALPAFSRDRHFEGYRGFGVIRPLEPRRDTDAPAADVAPAPTADAPSNVVRLPRAAAAAIEAERLSPPEQDAFRRIGVALGAEEVARHAGRPAPAVEAEPDDASKPEAPAAPAVTMPLEPAEPALAMAADAPAVRSDVRSASGEAAPAPAADGLDLLDAAEQKLLELEAILDTATDGILVVDEEGLVERINRSAEALFAMDAAAIVGRPFTELLAEESRRSALDYLDGLARNGVASVLNDGREVIGRVPQGGLIPLFMTMGRLPATSKFCAVLRDITQWKNAEEELINARRAAESASLQKSDFLAKVSHEIRTPLNAIIGFSEVMMEERFGPIGTERYKEYLRDIHVSGAHLMSLLNDLLDLSKIEAGKLDLSFQAVALNEIVMECVAVMQPQANRERIIIRTQLSGQVPNVVADIRSIRQIVLNLVSNAIKFTLAGGQVIVSTVMEEHGEVTLKIRDTGVGMSPGDIETALKPFRQLSTSRARRSDGTGLGLPLTKALVEANRAAFGIDSTVGQGTLVRVTFPATRVLAE